MTSAEFLQILNAPETMSLSQMYELENIVHRYPYFQVARALELKILYAKQSFRYNESLKITAAHIANRAILFDYITSEDFKNQSEKSVEEQIGTPLNFEKEDVYPFEQWLTITRYKPIREVKKEEVKALVNSELEENDPRFEKFNLIDKFLQNNPKIEPQKEFTPSIDVSSRVNAPKELMTETLAKVYAEQGKYKEAIKAYEILILKYPKKSRLFADRIEEIKKIQ